MEIDIFAICDFAQDMNGKLVIVGTFDIIFATKLPAVHPTCSIAARIRFSSNELGQHTFKITMLDDSSGKEIIIPPPSGELKLKIPSEQEWGAANIVIGIGLLKLPSYGRYSVNLLLDDKPVKSLTFFVKKTTGKLDGR